MRLVARNLLKPRMSNIDSIGSMRKGNEMAEISKAGPSNPIKALAQSHASVPVNHAPVNDLQDLDYNQYPDDHQLPELVDEHGNPTSPILSDTSMASNPAPVQSHVASVQLPSEFKTEYHPHSGRSTLYQTFDKFGITQEMQDAPIDKEPWCPFRSHGTSNFPRSCSMLH
ncbi:hypothetical protein EDB19DRAFT_1828661 [Suillus lakei]|nr:hypothetical protein EDB19DRAFT_1828661 [Suillus lakei]